MATNGSYDGLYLVSEADLKQGLVLRTENKSFDWWNDLFCAPDPRKAMSSVIIGDTITDQVNKKSGQVVETFVMPWRDNKKYHDWCVLMRQKWGIGANEFKCDDHEIISEIHYGGFVVKREARV
jgi:hypothetical protein